MSHVHALKTWPDHFQAVLDGRKRFQIRKADRLFRVGHELRLREYDPGQDAYTGRELIAQVDYKLDGPAFGLESGWVALSITVTSLELPDHTPSTL